MVGTGAIGQSEQGFSVALSADGNTALSGARSDNSGAGAVWVFTRTGGIWAQQGAKITASNNIGNASFGTSLSLSADGNTAAIGGPNDNAGIGATWILTRSGGVWSQQGGKLTGTGANGPAAQGWSVSLSADGYTLASGGYTDSSHFGAFWIFSRSGGTWAQLGSKRQGTGGVETPRQGYNVSISSDGGTIMSGGFTDAFGIGASWVFTSGSLAVPVYITGFSGNRNAQVNELQWTAIHHNGNEYFELERSVSGNNFELIARVPVLGPGNQANRYFFTDDVQSRPAPVYYYRLKMMQRPGVYQYSTVLSIKSGEVNNSKVFVFPNPVAQHSAIIIEVPGSVPEQADIIIKDAVGNAIWQKKVIVQPGSNNISADIFSRLPAAVYTVYVNIRSENKLFKIIKQ